MIGNSIEYIQAYTEIKCLLKYFPIYYISKLPNKLLEMIYRNSDEKYNIDVDLKKDLKNQNISKKTVDILAVLTYNYWSSENEKKDIIERLNENENNYQEELRKKYNPDNIFKNNDKTETTPQINSQIGLEENVQATTQKDMNQNVELTEIKENIFQKIIRKIKSMFR